MSDLADEAAARLRVGDLAGALDSISGEVRKRPAEPKLRVVLSQLLMIQGAWDRAANQLKVLGELDAGALPMVHAYRAAIGCERVREAVFAGERLPCVLGEPPRWIALQLQALNRFAKGDFTDAARLRDQAWEAVPEARGTIEGRPFSWFADSDGRVGPVFEALIEGVYYWIPSERVRAIRLEAPADLRDLVWLPAEFSWENGGSSVGFIPSRYPGSASAGDSFALARRTEWRDEEEDFVTALGQRVWSSSDGDHSLFEVRSLVFES